jgi:agmatinase
MSTSFDPSGPASHDGVFGLPFKPEESRVVLIPVPWEATVSYGAGAADGPAAILKASRQVDLRDYETGKPYAAGIAMLPISDEVRGWSDEARRLAVPVIEAGGAGDDPEKSKALEAVNALGARLNDWVYDRTREQLDAGRIPGVVGGDHSVPFGSMRAVAERFPGVGVLHFDAHADLRDAYEGFRWSHASIMNNVVREIPGVSRLVQVGIRDFGEDEEAFIAEQKGRVRTWFEPELRRMLFGGEPWNRVAARVTADLPRDVYVSFDIDALDPALCPHTGTPVPGGFSFAEATAILRVLVESGRRIVGLDLNEVAPDPEGRSEWDGNVGARLLYKMIGFTLLSQRDANPVPR